MRPCKVFGPNRTKMFHVKHFGTIVCATAAFVRVRMRPKIHWIDLPAGVRLAIMPRPRAGDWLDDEIAGWRAEGIGVIVSLFEAGEVKELSLHREAGLCNDRDMEFIAFPVQDGGVPAVTRKTMAIVEAIVARLDEGKAVAVHRRAGIGRSLLIAACVLVLFGLAPGMALDRIGKARGIKVPDTGGQRDWVDMFRESTTNGGIHPA
jgi:protein-tyrosine phosphatase